jgi:hypothetical protein
MGFSATWPIGGWISAKSTTFQGPRWLENRIFWVLL